MGSLFAHHLGVGQLHFPHPTAHTQLQLLVQAYVGFYVILVLSLVAFAALYGVVNWLRRDACERPDKAKEPCVSPDERDQTMDDWWNDFEDEREETV